MTLQEEVIELLHEVLLMKEEPPPKGTSVADISAFGVQNGIDIPPELEAWLCGCNGLLSIGGSIFGIHTSQQWLDIESFFKLYPVWKKQGWIPIAGDGCGNYYVLGKYSNEVSGHPVFFIDTHEDPNCLTYVVASSLWRFLRFFLGEEMGEDYWPFDKQRVLEKDPLLEKCQDAPLPWD